MSAPQIALQVGSSRFRPFRQVSALSPLAVEGTVLAVPHPVLPAVAPAAVGGWL